MQSITAAERHLGRAMPYEAIKQSGACIQHMHRQYIPFTRCIRPQLSYSILQKHPALGQSCYSRTSVRRILTCQASATETPTKLIPSPNGHPTNSPRALTLVVVPADKQHRLGASWHEVISHVAERLTWESPSFKVAIFTDKELLDSERLADFQQIQHQADIMLVLDVQSRSSLDTLTKGMRLVPTSLALNSLPELEAATRLNNVTLETTWQKTAAAIPWSNSAKGTKILTSIRDVYQRNTSDDLLFMLLVLIDAYITKVC